jgi:hypothetical protein
MRKKKQVVGMMVRIDLVLDVGDDPTSDAITFMIHQYDTARGDDLYTPDAWVEQVVQDVLTHELADSPTPVREWEIVSSACSVVEA